MQTLPFKAFLSALSCSGTICSFNACNSLPGKDDPPNVIIVLTDDQGYGDFSILGNPVLETHVLDELHNQSIRLADFHVAPMSTPSRGQLITGRDALDNGATAVCMGRSMVREDLPTMADNFKTSGYQTAHFGKWHMGDSYPYRPQDRGFDETVHHGAWGITSIADYNNTRYIHIGSDKQNPILLYSNDWQGSYADNPGNLIAGDRIGSWDIIVETAGKYEVTLCRWHPASGIALNAPLILNNGEVGAIPVAQARLKVGDIDQAFSTSPGQNESKFTIELNAGIPVIET